MIKKNNGTTEPATNRATLLKHPRQFPHIYVILLSIAFIASIMTYIIPSGQYKRVDIDGRTVVDPNSFTYVPRNPVSLLGFFESVPKGLIDTANIIFFIFIVGGSFGVLQKTGAVEAALKRLADKMRGRGIVAIPFIMAAFGFAGATFGMAEETLPFIPIVTTLMISLGFDKMTGAMVVLCGAGSGFAAAITNPFTIGIAQGIAGLPLFSGFSFRLVMLFLFEALTITYTCIYAKRVNLSLKNQNNTIGETPLKDAAATAPSEDATNFESDFDLKKKIILVIFIATLFALILGVVKFGWYMTQIAALFFAMSMLIAAIACLGVNGWAESLTKGMINITSGALVVGFAKAVPIILTDSFTLDTILHAAQSLLNRLPKSIIAMGMYLVQCALNFLLPSGGGQAAVSMPIMGPLADMTGITRQVAVIAFQLGDGISNIFFPTSGYFMAALALGKIDYIKWVKAVALLIGAQYVLGAIFVIAAQLIKLGPF